MMLREMTQDEVAFREVYLDNEYAITERFGPEDVIVDIGAHIGSFSLLAIRQGARKLVCLEPQEDNFTLLQHNLLPYAELMTSLDLRPLAIWAPEEAGRIGLTSPKDSRFTAMHQVHPGRGTPVPSVGLDELLLELGPVRLLKIDCEGGEWPALYTCLKLGLVQEIVGELHRVVRWDRSPRACTMEAMRDYLEEVGLEVELRGHPRSPEQLCLFRARRRAFG